MQFHSPSQALKSFYNLINTSPKWELYLDELSIKNADGFIKAFKHELYAYSQERNVAEYNLTLVYDFFKCISPVSLSEKILPQKEEIAYIENAPILYLDSCREYYNDPQNHYVIELLSLYKETSSLISFAFQFIPKALEIFPQCTTKYLASHHYGEIIIWHVLFIRESSYPLWKDLQQNALTVLFLQKFASRKGRNQYECYKTIIDILYKNSDIDRQKINSLVNVILYSKILSSKQKEILIKRIDKCDCDNYEKIKNNFPDISYNERYYAPTTTHAKIIYTPMGGMNKRH
ncbi:MAG: hypothetical protein IKN59_00335 [Paludibacteraceae bacterium]|nr:hypothetical protein [Paludibacteraceae bacterium]